ncbi:glycosyltransferase family 2 protein [Desulforamulus aeronauticus]|uniref:Glycosyl transferase family 2 n=1 Tax=Desulforamulus aeronauticus DSM 10349 TaxID=1121421 RepID=A0A1M6V7P5_9FIRM|nr:glycosyltransferase family A protein [Desulforamulus aeronauticus]SHK77391.1 Glycosyl transferase family 2 [Desulforamulus aeronauticus DSM 10349]
MWEVVGYLLMLILACYGVYYVVQDIVKLLQHAPGPPVSMLVVLRNRERDIEYLMRRLESWRKHQWVELEVLVVDDGSEDDTRRILTALQGKCNFRLITVTDDKHNVSQGDQARQVGLLHCHNALVWLVDLRRLPQGLLAEKVFRVFFSQGWR